MVDDVIFTVFASIAPPTGAAVQLAMVDEVTVTVPDE